MLDYKDVFPISDTKFRGLMARRTASHTDIWSTIPPLGSFVFFSSFSSFVLPFIKDYLR